MKPFDVLFLFIIMTPIDVEKGITMEYLAVIFMLVVFLIIIVCFTQHERNNYVNVPSKCLKRSTIDLSSLDDCVYIIIIGESESGKTSTMKSLVQNEVHKYDNSDICYSRNYESFGRNVEIIECNSSSSKNVGQIEENLRNVFNHQDQTHAILLCIPFQEDMKNDFACYLEALRSVYGPGIVKKNVIVAITFGERFEKIKKSKGYKNFKHWKNMFKIADLKTLIRECNDRCILIQNGETNEKIMQNQAHDFFEMVDQIKHENSKRINAEYTIGAGVCNSSEIGNTIPQSGKEIIPPTTLPIKSLVPKEDQTPMIERYFTQVDPNAFDNVLKYKNDRIDK